MFHHSNRGYEPAVRALAVALIVLGAAAGKGQAGEDTRKIVLTQTTKGGYCPYLRCHPEMVVFNDGTGIVRYAAKDEIAFSLSSRQRDELIRLVEEADFKRLSESKFHGNCPTAYDGEEYVYTFFTTHGKHVLDSCEVSIDYESPLFKAIQQIKVY